MTSGKPIAAPSGLPMVQIALPSACSRVGVPAFDGRDRGAELRPFGHADHHAAGEHQRIRAERAHHRHRRGEDGRDAGQRAPGPEIIAEDAEQHRRDSVGEHERRHQKAHARGVRDADVGVEFGVREQHGDIDAVEEGGRDRDQEHDRHRPAQGLPAAAAALVLSDATLASCTCPPSRDLSDHR